MSGCELEMIRRPVMWWHLDGDQCLLSRLEVALVIPPYHIFIKLDLVAMHTLSFRGGGRGSYHHITAHCGIVL